MTDETTRRALHAALYSAGMQASNGLKKLTEAPMHWESNPTLTGTTSIEAAKFFEDAARHLMRAADIAAPTTETEERKTQ